MDENQYKELKELLIMLDKLDILKYFIIVGSWSMYFYKKDLNYNLGILRTRDIDFLIATSDIKKKVNLLKEMENIGFDYEYSYPDNHLRIFKPDIMVEFLIANKGKGLKSPYELKNLNINAEPLRFMDILIGGPIVISKWDISFKIPSPERFVLHKLIVSVRRKNKEKREKDYFQAVGIKDIMKEKGELYKIEEVYNSLSDSYKKWIKKAVNLRNKEDWKDIFSELK